MKTKTFLLFLPAILLTGVISPLAFADSPTSTASSSLSSLTSLPMPVVPPLIAEIQQAKTQLSNITLNHALTPIYRTVKNKKTGKASKIISSYQLGDKDIALAILNPSTNSIITTLGRLNGTDMVFPDPAVNVALTNFNGVNSQFQINQPAGGVVLALKYLISGPSSGSKAAIEDALTPVIYVPYSDALDDPQVNQYGANYLSGVIQKVAVDLATQPSQAVPGETVPQAISPALVKALVYAEHTDTTAVLYGDAQSSLDALNIILAANGPDAYKYSVSNDGFASRGIAQFVKSTYESLVQRHPNAGLDPNYVTGMQDHENSIKAMYLLLDDYAGDVRVKAAQGFASGQIFDYAAAAYNGGTTRVANAVLNYGANWNADRTAEIGGAQASVNSLTAETSVLRAKIRKTTVKKTKTALQSQLAAVQSQLSSANSQLSQLQSSSLRPATLNYLAKIYKVISVFNGQT